jgi:hypothetical protein
MEVIQSRPPAGTPDPVRMEPRFPRLALLISIAGCIIYGAGSWFNDPPGHFTPAQPDTLLYLQYAKA